MLSCVVGRDQVAYAAACMAVIGGALCYLLCDFAAWPRLMYEPYERAWLIASEPPSAAAMVYPGMLLWGLCGAVVCAAGTLVVASSRTTPLGRGPIALLGAWALSATGFVGAYFLWGLWPF
ncbi:MAG: hypothetical protein GY811_22170 [Myxococcales bacterium]|nr:hypothetical protein [Myxococcales bacterium]